MTLKVNIHTFGLTKYTIYCKNCSCCFFLFFFSLCCYYAFFFRLKKLFQVKNGLTTSLLFCCCLKIPKIWVGRTTLKGEKIENGLTNFKMAMLRAFFTLQNDTVALPKHRHQKDRSWCVHYRYRGDHYNR